jgi:hypothetical protein
MVIYITFVFTTNKFRLSECHLPAAHVMYYDCVLPTCTGRLRHFKLLNFLNIVILYSVKTFCACTFTVLHPTIK